MAVLCKCIINTDVLQNTVLNIKVAFCVKHVQQNDQLVFSCSINSTFNTTYLHWKFFINLLRKVRNQNRSSVVNLPSFCFSKQADDADNLKISKDVQTELNTRITRKEGTRSLLPLVQKIDWLY